MSQVKNISGEARYVPELFGRLVEAGEVVTVPNDRLEGYTCQSSTWAEVKKPAARAAKKPAAAGKE